jgi:hypothetical protein
MGRTLRAGTDDEAGVGFFFGFQDMVCGWLVNSRQRAPCLPPFIDIFQECEILQCNVRWT